MKHLPRTLNPDTNPGLYTALLGVAFAIWQALQVEAAKGPLTWPEVGRVAAGVVFAAAAGGWQRSKTTPVKDPKDGAGNPLKPVPQDVIDAFQRLAAPPPPQGSVPPAVQPPAAGMHVDPQQIPANLMQPAMDAGQPPAPAVRPMSARPGRVVEGVYLGDTAPSTRLEPPPAVQPPATTTGTAGNQQPGENR